MNARHQSECVTLGPWRNTCACGLQHHTEVPASACLHACIGMLASLRRHACTPALGMLVSLHLHACTPAMGMLSSLHRHA
eukprot:359460-Chlamydomonas_euryale.AAC.7